MTKLFDDTLFSDTITINKREYNAADVALYTMMMDELVGHTNSDFIKAMDMELRVMLSCMSQQDVKIIQYHKLKVMQEFDKQQLRSRIMKKRMLSQELNEKQEFEKSINLIKNEAIERFPNEPITIQPTIAENDGMETITDEPDEVLF